MDLDWLREAHRRTRKDGAVGVDKQTAAEFGEDLEGNLQSLLDEAKSGTYRAPPVRRVHIPKGDGSKTRPIGIPTYADKVLQRGVAMLLEPIFERDFYNFSYGFRPHRSAHDALEALRECLWSMDGGWVLEVDIKGFFDHLDHEKLRDLLRLRVTDGTVVRLIGKWLRAGALEGGVVYRSDSGTPQGGVISPILANYFLHKVVDEWWVEMVLPRMTGQAHMVRYADDFVMVFSSQEDALRVQRSLAKRVERFGLSLHPEKTRLIEYRRPRDGGPRPGSFDFLGFTHYWGRTRKGRWAPQRKTSRSRFTRSLRSLSDWMRRARNLPVAKQAEILRSKLRGHFQYYGVRGNSAGITRFRYEAERLWKKWLSRRSQRAALSWTVFHRLLAHHKLPPARLAVKWWQPSLPFREPMN
jgi:group II intron reverse transcriptase/maturase